MPTLLEHINDIDAVQRRFETDILQLDAKIAALKLEKHKLHSGVNRKLSTLSRLVSKAAEVNAKSIL
jgi:hypothetical protein